MSELVSGRQYASSQYIHKSEEVGHDNVHLP